MDELLPALDVRLDPGRELAVVIRAALGGQIAHLRLESPPLEQTKHALAVHVAGRADPIVLLAEPMGFSSEGLFPLRLSTLGDEQRADLGGLLAMSNSLPPLPSVEADPLLGRLLAGGKYHLLRLLGAGGAGRVYEAEHVDLAKRVAIKVLHPVFAKNAEYVVRFRDEALTASRLNHPNVARTVDFGQERDGTLYLVMELLEGAHLQAALETEGPFSLERAIAVLTQVCAALAAAHERGIIHRDIKPENIVLLAGRGDDGAPIDLVKVCDFGLAQLEHDGRPGAAGQLSGTPEYMSPEQGRGEVLDARSDLYACGVVLYQLLVGKVPFEAGDMRVLLLKHSNEAPPRPSDARPELPARIDRVVLRAMAKDRDDRFASARDMRLALQHVMAPGVSEPPPELMEIVPLSDPKSGFTRFFDAVLATVFDRYKSAGHVLVDSARSLLSRSGELTIACGPPVGSLMVLSGSGEVARVVELGEPALATSVARLEKRMREAKVVSITFREGLAESDVAALTALEKAGHAAGLAISVLPAADVLGRARKLPWAVELVMSRIAHDLGTLWSDAKMDPARRRQWRQRLMRDALGSLEKIDNLTTSLRHGDLIESVLGPALEGTFVERALEVVPSSRCMEIADGILAGSGAPLPRAVLVALGRRLATELTTETEAVLRALDKRGFLGFADLPAQAQDWLRGSEGAATLSRDPQRALAPLVALDDKAYARELAWIRHALPVVIRRGDASAARAVVAALVAHRAGTPSEPRQSAIAQTLAVLAQSDVKRSLAEIVLYGDPPQREPARTLLAGQREGAVAALVEAADRAKPW